jgi:hypothetical protein
MVVPVVAHGCALVLWEQVEVGEQPLERAIGPLGPVEYLVEVCYVAAVVLIVMHPHCQLVDRRGEGVVRIRERRQCMRVRVLRPRGGLASVEAPA